MFLIKSLDLNLFLMSVLTAEKILGRFKIEISTFEKFLTSLDKSRQHLCTKVSNLDMISFECLDLNLFLKSVLTAEKIPGSFKIEISTVVKFLTVSNTKSQQHLCPKVLILDLISFESLDLNLFLKSVLTAEKFLAVSKLKSPLSRNSWQVLTSLANTYALKFQILT
jgi:hypothetical protein